MLPNAKESLRKGGFAPKTAAWILFLCFLAGAAGIQVVSKIAHRYIPSHIIGCDHSHDDDDEDCESGDYNHDRIHDHAPPLRSNQRHDLRAHADGSQCDFRSPSVGTIDKPKRPLTFSASSTPELPQANAKSMIEAPLRPRLASNWTGRVSKVLSSTKQYCDEHGQCYGFTDPCGHDCFKIVESRGGLRVAGSSHARGLGLLRSPSTPQRQTFSREHDRQHSPDSICEVTPLLRQQDDLIQVNTPLVHANGRASGSASASSKRSASPRSDCASSHHSHTNEHHHHVPQNAFLSIGLQTSLAIALHKLPEGFITYATNHANPSLGFSVFLALFIHNITEGFAMALPLFLAMRNRPKAVLISSLLGGISQPLGAAVAALWFKVAGSGDSQPGEGVYGVMFAIVAGIMTSVALQLFSESLDLTHNRNLCMAFAFVGMGVLGLTGSLTAR